MSALAILAAGTSVVAAAESTLKVGDHAPKLQTGKWLQGDPVNEFEKGKAYIVEFWATWCGPCRSEVPALVTLHKQFQSRGVEIVGLSTENPTASAESVRKFVDELKVDYPIGWASPELYAALTQGTDRIPQSFIFARDGHVVKHFIGFGKINTPETIKAALEEALNDKG